MEEMTTGLCPKCGHTLQIPAELERFSCMYCGERLTKLPDTPEMFTVICKPDVSFSTPALLWPPTFSTRMSGANSAPAKLRFKIFTRIRVSSFRPSSLPHSAAQKTCGHSGKYRA